jgi:hypothetical protein
MLLGPIDVLLCGGMKYPPDCYPSSVLIDAVLNESKAAAQ